MDEPTPPRSAFAAYVTQAPATTVLMAACAMVALVSGVGQNMQVLTWLTLADLRGFDDTIAGGLRAVRDGEVWRLVTPIFIHFGPLHIIFNLLMMKDIGLAIERRWGTRTLLGLVLVSAVLSNLVQFVVNWDLQGGLRYANALSGGMSGVLYALFGYVWVRGHLDPTAGIRLPSSVVWTLLIWLVVCMTGLLGSIGNSAHSVGLLVGLAWGWIATHLRPRDEARSGWA